MVQKITNSVSACRLTHAFSFDCCEFFNVGDNVKLNDSWHLPVKVELGVSEGETVLPGTSGKIDKKLDGGSYNVLWDNDKDERWMTFRIQGLDFGQRF